MKNRIMLWAALLLPVMVAGCARRQNNAPLTDDQNKAKTTMDAQMQAAAQTASDYHAMDDATLLNHLLEQSKAQTEYFNSPAYRELKTRSDVDPKALVAQVQANNNAGGLLPLLLLRRLNNQAYLGVPAEVRAHILTDALENAKYFNNWGLPDFYLEDAAHATIESGKSAVPALKRLLTDTRPAPVFGSQEAMLSNQYKYRVCDYALYFLEVIGGQTNFRLPASSDERDALIKKAGR
jgi:hypothetical protein